MPKGLNLLESQIRYAMENTKSNSSAARFLGISLPTYIKYASSYIDARTGKTLLELHSNIGGKGISRIKTVGNQLSKKLEEVLEGKHPDYDVYHLKVRLIRSGTFPAVCSSCGYDEQRITDGKTPLLLDFLDSDRTNFLIDNLRLLCYNCYYVQVGNFIGAKAQL